MFVGKHVLNISLLNVLVIDEFSLVGDEEMPNTEPIFRPIKSYTLKVLIHEDKVLQEIIVLSTTNKDVCEGLIKMLSL